LPRKTTMLKSIIQDDPVDTLPLQFHPTCDAVRVLDVNRVG
jgi:hypothetical protein